MNTSPNPPGDVLTPPRLLAAFQAVDQERALRVDGRRQPAGPIGQIHRAARAAGWRFINATTLDTGEGTFDLITNSPAAMATTYRLHYRRRMDERATCALNGQGTTADEHGRMEVFHFNPVRKLREKLLRHKKVTRREPWSGSSREPSGPLDAASGSPGSLATASYVGSPTRTKPTGSWAALPRSNSGANYGKSCLTLYPGDHPETGGG